MALAADDHQRIAAPAPEAPDPRLLAVRDEFLPKPQDDLAALVQDVPVAGADRAHPAAVPGDDGHAVHVRSDVLLPEDRAVVVQEEVAAVHLVPAVPVDVSHRGEVGRAVSVLAPRALVLPEDVQVRVEREDAAAELDDEIAGRLAAAQVGDQDPLVGPVRPLPAARPQRLGRRLELDGSRLAVAELDDEVLAAGRVRLRSLVLEEADDLRASVPVQIVDGHRPRPRRLRPALPVAPERDPVRVEGAQEAGPGRRLHPRAAGRSVDQEVGPSAVPQVAHTDIAPVRNGAALNGLRHPERLGNVDHTPEDGGLHGRAPRVRNREPLAEGASVGVTGSPSS